MEQQIHGNITGIRQNVLAQMTALYEYPIDSDIFIPDELARALAEHSAALNREISVYISRDGDILDITVGGIDSVPLQDWHLRRSAKRLSCVRCVHTHPGGSCELSDVDIAALKSLMLDAMCAIGVSQQGIVTGVSAAFLGARTGGELSVHTEPSVSLRRLPQADWMRQIILADERTRDDKAPQETEDSAPERAILVGIESEESLNELEALAQTAGAVVVGRTLQKKTKPDTATFIGSGKASELSLDAQALEADLVIVDDELTGSQTRNLEELAGVKVVDRTTLILDIFAQRAKTSEGKLQVQLAQCKYQSTRLMGQGLVLSRLAGGIGTRGPGESKLEIDRRRLRERITALRGELDALEKQRALRRKSREKNAVPVVALVGYTNTGKSTLLNALSGADVFIHDQLFATLDAVSRTVKLPQGGEFILVDTVGFIRKLPHDLVEAFHSTLEEATLADVLVIVSDASSPECESQRAVVEEVLDSLGANTQTRIDALNKCDKAERLPDIPGAVEISAVTGKGLDELLLRIASALRKSERTITLLVPYSHYAMLSELRAGGRAYSEAHDENGVRVTVTLDETVLGRLQSKYGAEIISHLMQ